MSEKRNLSPIAAPEWARSHGISSAPSLPAIEGHDEPCPFSAREVAARAVILQGVVAVAYEVDAEPVVDWLVVQGLWDQVSPREQGFLLAPASFDQVSRQALQWRQEAEWSLLWVIGKVEALGLPTRQCDTRRMVDELIPQLGADLDAFLGSAELRSPGELLAEDDRHYDLWCYYFQDRRESPDSLPADLELQILYQRRYVFEWLRGISVWDDVRCDA